MKINHVNDDGADVESSLARIGLELARIETTIVEVNTKVGHELEQIAEKVKGMEEDAHWRMSKVQGREASRQLSGGAFVQIAGLLGSGAVMMVAGILATVLGTIELIVAMVDANPGVKWLWLIGVGLLALPGLGFLMGAGSLCFSGARHVMRVREAVYERLVPRGSPVQVTSDFVFGWWFSVLSGGFVLAILWDFGGFAWGVAPIADAWSWFGFWVGAAIGFLLRLLVWLPGWLARPGRGGPA